MATHVKDTEHRILSFYNFHVMLSKVYNSQIFFTEVYKQTYTRNTKLHSSLAALSPLLDRTLPLLTADCESNP